MSRRRGGIIVQISSPRFYDLSKVWQVARLNGGVVFGGRGEEGGEGMMETKLSRKTRN